MRRFTPTALLACLFVLGSSAAVRADDADELKEKAHALLKQSAVAAKDGRMDEARKLKMQAAELLEKIKPSAPFDKVFKDNPLPEGATDADHLKHKLHALQNQWAAATDKGDLDEAKRLKQQAAELTEKLRAVAGQDKVKKDRVVKDRVKFEGSDGGFGSGGQHLKDHLKKLYEKAEQMKQAGASSEAFEELKEHIVAAETKLRSIHASHEVKPPDDAQVAKLKEAMQRVEHLHAAAKHLMQAGAEDVAHQIMRQAEAMAREVAEAKKAMAAAAANKDRRDDQSELVRDLRAEIERLRAEVKELRQKGEKKKKKERKDKDPDAKA